MRARGERRRIPAAHRGPRPDPQPARIRRRHLRGFALARPRLGRASVRSVAAHRSLCRCARPVARARARLCLLLHPSRHRTVADCAARATPRPLIPALAGASRRSQRRAATPHCWRLDSAKALGAGRCRRGAKPTARNSAATPDIGDAILARKDAPASYHLSCVVDDAASGVTLVVRGADLRPSTPIQRLLQELLGLPEPAYLHHALVTHADGRRLAKRDLAPTLAAMREAAWTDRARRPTCSTASFPLVSRSGRLRAAMRWPLLILLVLAMAATAYVLVRGVIAMARARTSPASSSRTGCASACCSRRWRSSSSS